MSKKHQDLQPWLNYFKMLHTYETKGYLEVHPGKHEAYLTQPALFTLLPDGILSEKTDKGLVADLARRIRAYAGWKSQSGEAYLNECFALHIVKDAEPHDLMLTLLLKKPFPWFAHWPKTDRVEYIIY